jgi:glycerophosphoryl diester phosphodiesterase
MSLGHLFPGDRTAAIAHRGGSRLRPENTLAAFDHAVSLGVDGLECDIHLSADGVPVIIHDATLDRTTEATGPVAARTAAELRGLGVPALADLLDRHPDTPVVVEMKIERPTDAPAVLRVLRAARRQDRYLVGSFRQEVLDAVRRLAPEFPTGASRREVVSAIRRSYFGIRPRRTGCAVFQVPFVFQGRQIFGESFVRTVARAGFGVQSWIIDDELVMRRLIGWGVTALISDRPDVAVRVVRGSGPDARLPLRTP